MLSGGKTATSSAAKVAVAKARIEQDHIGSVHLPTEFQELSELDFGSGETEDLVEVCMIGDVWL